MESLAFSIRPIPPFRLDLTAWALRRRARNIVDRWDGTTYRRVLVSGDVPLELSVTQVGSSEHPKLALRITGSKLATDTRARVVQLLSRALGLRTNLQPFYALAAKDPRLAPLVEQFRGLKPPRFPSILEGFVNAIACQQLSLTVGIELLNRLATHCGPTITSSGAVQHAFPGAEDLLRVKAPTFRHLGFSYSKARSLLSLARDTVEGQFYPEHLQDLDNESAVQESLTLRGVGRWTAEYVLLRGLGRLDTFPGDDVGARNRLALWLGRDGPLDYEGVKRAVKRWQPYAGLVYFHLLLAGLTESGEMPRDRVERAS
jgi:DNA-3-methyladenine glycosylase II